MALVRGKIIRVAPLLASLHLRRFSKTTFLPSIKKSVFISQSNDVYTNLALEYWLYKNANFNNHQVLLISQNDPCIVIGANENPWININNDRLTNLPMEGLLIQLARRQTDGKPIYQDNGNLNLTFFSATRDHQYNYNLDLIMRAIFRQYSVKMRISSDKDLLIRNSKVSSTSLKLGSNNAYHQCSLMVNVNKDEQKNFLFTKELNENGKFINLKEENYNITENGLISAIGWEYMRMQALSRKDGGRDLANKQNGFQMINPTEQWFPGITEIRDELAGWEWNYGKTPKFHISRLFLVPADRRSKIDGHEFSNLNVTLTVEHGIIHDAIVLPSSGFTKSGCTDEIEIIMSLKGCKFSADTFKFLEYNLNALDNDYDEKKKIVSDSRRRIMTSL